MTSKLDALVKAGEMLAEIVDEANGDPAWCSPSLGHALSSWRSALADLRAEEQPAPVPGDGRDVILDLVETCDCERIDRRAAHLVSLYRSTFSPPEAGIANLLAKRKHESLTTAAILAHLRGKTLRPVLLARRAVGIKTYGHPLHPGDVPALEYALDEAADLPIYIHQGELEQQVAAVREETGRRYEEEAAALTARLEQAEAEAERLRTERSEAWEWWKVEVRRAMLDLAKELDQAWRWQGVVGQQGAGGRALLDVAKELDRAKQLHGPYHSAHEGFAVLLEEVDELKAEVWPKQALRSPERMRTEAIQVATVALRFAIDLCDGDLSR